MTQETSTQLDLIFAALSDPTRRAILTMLLEDDMAVSDVADPFDMSLAAISKHLQILTRAGLIAQERRGRVKWCKLDPVAMKEASIWMESFGQFENVNLDAFEAFLKSETIQIETGYFFAGITGLLTQRSGAVAYGTWHAFWGFDLAWALGLCDGVLARRWPCAASGVGAA
jgi:DNA-binding transcriptional ArsR family regulator